MNARLSLLCGALMLVGGCRGGESEEPPVHLIQNMYTQEKSKPYRKDDTGLFPDGRTMHLPVDGTVAVGQLNDDSLYDDGIDPTPKLIDGGTSTTPAVTFVFPHQIQLDDGGIPDATVERGHLRFGIYCTPCHGITGAGDGVLSKKAFDGGTRLDVPPANLLDQRVKDMPIGQIFTAMTKGVNGGNMPSYATQIPVADRWAIAAYVRTIENVGFDGKPPEPPPSERQDFGLVRPVDLQEPRLQRVSLARRKQDCRPELEGHLRQDREDERGRRDGRRRLHPRVGADAQGEDCRWVCAGDA